MRKSNIKLNKEQEELFDDNWDLAEIKSNSWIIRKDSYYTREDLFSYALQGLAIAAKNYKYDRNCSFRTYASIVIKHEIMHEVEYHNKVYENEIPAEIYCNNINNEALFYNNADINGVELNMVIEQYLSYCDPIDKKIFREVIIKDRSRTDVAAELNISIQTVSTKIKEMQKEFINFMNLQ